MSSPSVETALRSLVALCMLLALATCGGSESPTQTQDETPVPTSIELSASEVRISRIGETQELTATVRDQNGRAISDASVTWSSDDEAVASVVGGVVTAESSGEATVTATSGSLSASAGVTVSVPIIARDVSLDTLVGYEGVWISPTPRIQVLDWNGAPLSGVTVQWSALDGSLSGGISSDFTSTDSNGFTGMGWWGGSPGIDTLTVTAQLDGASYALDPPFIGRIGRGVEWLTEFGEANWKDPSNWADGTAPSSSDYAVFNANGTHSVIVDSEVEVAGIGRLKIGQPEGTGDTRLVLRAGGRISLTDSLVYNDPPTSWLEGGTIDCSTSWDSDVVWSSGRIDSYAPHHRCRFFLSSADSNLTPDLIFGGNERPRLGMLRVTRGDGKIELETSAGLLFEESSDIGVGASAEGANLALTGTSPDKPSVVISENAVVTFAHGDTEPSTLILSGIDLVLAGSVSFANSGNLPAVGDWYDLVLLEQESTITSSAPLASDTNFEYQLNPEPGVGVRAIRRN